MVDNRKVIYSIIRRQNLQALPVALLCFVLLIPISVIMLLAIPFALIFALLSLNPKAFIEMYNSTFFTPWGKVVKTFWFSAFPKTYPLRDVPLNDNLEEVPEIKGEGIYYWGGLLFIKERMSFDVIPVAEVVWLYLRFEKTNYKMKYSQQTIATSMRNAVVLKTERGKHFNVTINELGSFSSSIKQKMAINTVEEICVLCNNAVVGYSNEREKIYRKNPMSFAKTIKELE